MIQDVEIFETLKKLLTDDRSVRRFDNSKRISRKTLLELVDLTRFCASARNAQPIKYFLVDNEETCKKVYPLLAWAGYYKNWAGPEPHQRPAAYIIQCLDAEIASDCLCDDGLHLQAISLGATALGLSGCIIKAFNALKLSEILELPQNINPIYVYALGVAAEKVVIKDINPDGDYKYFRDEQDRQCVPKRSLNQIIIN